MSATRIELCRSCGQPISSHDSKCYVGQAITSAIRADRERLKEGAETLRIHKHVHHGSYVQGNNKAIDGVLALFDTPIGDETNV